jgi:hypothetical protein
LFIDSAPTTSFMAQAMPEMSDAEYQKLAQLIYKVSGSR